MENVFITGPIVRKSEPFKNKARGNQQTFTIQSIDTRMYFPVSAFGDQVDVISKIDLIDTFVTAEVMLVSSYGKIYLNLVNVQILEPSK